MKTLRFSLILVICLATLSLAACSSTEPATDKSATKPSETSRTQQPSSTSALSDPVSQSTVGELQEVDLAAHTVTIKNAEGRAEIFFFTEYTQIVGTADAQGLSVREGSQVTVGYTDKDGRKTAGRIEVVPK